MNRRNTFNSSAAGQTLDKILEAEIVLAKSNLEKIILAGYSKEQVKPFSAMVYRAQRYAGKIACYLQQINKKLMALQAIGIEGHFLAALYKEDRLKVAEQFANGEILSYLKNVINQRFALYFKGELKGNKDEVLHYGREPERCHCPGCGIPTIPNGPGLTFSDMECESCYRKKETLLDEKPFTAVKASEVEWDDNALKNAPSISFQNLNG